MLTGLSDRSAEVVMARVECSVHLGFHEGGPHPPGALRRRGMSHPPADSEGTTMPNSANHTARHGAAQNRRRYRAAAASVSILALILLATACGSDDATTNAAGLDPGGRSTSLTLKEDAPNKQSTHVDTAGRTGRRTAVLLLVPFLGLITFAAGGADSSNKLDRRSRNLPRE